MLSQTFAWKRCFDATKFQEILNMVEPYEEERNMIVYCIQHNICYHSYIAVDALDFVVAIAIATFLPKTQTLHVVDFALHPKIRKQKHAKQLWLNWRKLVKSEWTETESLTIEVYLQNVEAWKKILGVNEILPNPQYLLPLAPNVPMMFMGRNLTCPANEVLAEWQQLQTNVRRLVPF